MGALLSSALVGCGALNEAIKAEKGPADYGDVAAAVTEAVPRVVEVDDLGRSRNGFGYRLSVGFVTDSAEPFTSDELDAVVETIWQTLPWEPNTIELIAGTADGEGVDLRAAAEELGPLSATEAGQAGVSLTGMTDRYGDWKAPE
ncbi:hypothetical protein [Microbacterium sp. NPDC057650]|uniref:hypothetical protein n=1 Tax=unclassified Microbacterium TaxID=2609290 RepID=UPI00366D0467